MLVTPVMQHQNGTLSNSNRYSGHISKREGGGGGGGLIKKSLGGAEFPLQGSEEKHLQKLKHMQVWQNGW